jgi:hypothetical protein
MSPFPALKRCGDALAPSRATTRILFINIKSFGFPGIVIPASKTSLILIASCLLWERFLEAILQRAERKLAGPGRPGTVDRPVAKVERREALRPTSLGARGALPREAGTLIPSPRVPAGALAPPAAPPPRAGIAGDWQTSDASRRENKKPWLFEIRIQKFRKATRHTPPSFRDGPPELGFTRVRHYHCPSRLRPTWTRRPGIHSPCVAVGC